MDNNFTKKLQAYLNTPREQRDINVGATMLLQLNQNKFQYASIIRLNNWDALEYELNKHLRIRLDGMTREAVAAMEPVVMKEAEQILSTPVRRGRPRKNKNVSVDAPIIDASNDFGNVAVVMTGKRKDHDKLPADIRKCWEDNANIWHNIKQTYNQLITMEDKTPCDRYELLKILGELDKKYHTNLATYDGYKK